MTRIHVMIGFVAITLLSACGFDTELEEISMGENFVSSQAGLVIADTFSINLSTVILDSVVTSGSGILWTGAYQDEEFGEISASSYFELEIPTSVDVTGDDRYDSLSLVLYYTSKYRGDTLSPQTIQVYPLTKDLDLDANDRNNYYNASTVPIGSNLLGEYTFKPYPGRKDSIMIRLSDELGADLLQRLKDNEDTLTNQEVFKKYLPGLAILPGQWNTALLEFHADSTLKMKLHTTRPGIENSEIENNFLFTNEESQFNHVHFNRFSTSPDDSDNNSRIPASEIQNKTFVHSGLGVLTRIDFPSLQLLLEMEQEYDLNRAELILYPVPGTYMDIAPPSELVLYHTDKYNNLLDEIVDESYGTVLPAEFNLDSVYHENTFYRFDVTSYISDEISDGYFDTNHGLLIGETTSEQGQSLDRVVFSASPGSGFKPRFQLYFLFYNSGL